MVSWEGAALTYYLDGLKYGGYPSAIMERLSDELNGCRDLIDICSGPGAFSLWALGRGWQVTATDLSESALNALSRTAGEGAALTTIPGDLSRLTLPAADVAVAACCFYEKTATAPVLGKMLDAAKKTAIFVQHEGPQPAEFGTAGLPSGKRSHTWSSDHDVMESELLKAAAARGLEMRKFTVECDFGCHYAPEDEEQLAFIARKSGVLDSGLLAEHLAHWAIDTPHGKWLPNPKRYKVIWTRK